MALVPHRRRNEHFTHGIPIYAHVLELLELYYRARVLLLFAFLLLLVCVKQNVFDREAEGERVGAREVIVFVPDMDVLDVVFDSSEKPGCKAKKWRLLEPSLLLGRLASTSSAVVFVLVYLVSIICFLHLLLFLADISPYTLSHRFPKSPLLLLSLVFIMSLRSPHLMNNSMHQQYISNLIMYLIFTCFRVFVKVLRLRHLILVWTKYEMNITQFKFH